MKVHKYWAIGVAIAMTGTFYTGHKYNGKAHKAHKALGAGGTGVHGYGDRHRE